MATKKKAKSRKRASSKGNKKPSNKAYQVITDAVIEAIETLGKLPWQCDWVRRRHGGAMLKADGKPYQGSNQLILGLIAMARGFNSRRWLGWNTIQANLKTAEKTEVCPETGEILVEAGWKIGGVRKDEKSSPSVYFNRVKVKDRDAPAQADGTQPTKWLRLVRYSRVWNADQVDGLPPRFYEKPKPEELPDGWRPLEEAQRILEEFFTRPEAPELTHQGDRAFYKPSRDQVNLPERARFKSPEGYYSTAFHEMGHATGAEKRLNRDSATSFHFFGDANYSREELVAELTAAFVMADAGIATEDTNRNTVAYLQSWLQALKSNPDWIVWASSRAEAAAHWIHTGEAPVYKSDDEEVKQPEEDATKVTVVGFGKAA